MKNWSRRWNSGLTTGLRSMGKFALVMAHYIVDGFRVLPLPVTVFRNAAQRNLGFGAVFAVYAVLFCLLATTDWLKRLWFTSVFVELGEPIVAPSGLMALAIAADGILSLAFFLFSGALSYGLVLLFRGTGGIRQLYSAFLVLVAFAVSASIIALGFVVLAYGFAASASEGVQVIAATMLLAGPVVFGAISLSYTILAIRFGGNLSIPLSFICAFLTVAVTIVAGFAFDLLLGRPPMRFDNLLSVFVDLIS